MSGAQLLLSVGGGLRAVVHNTTEGGGEGTYTTTAGGCTVAFANTGLFSATAGPGLTAYTWLLGGAASQAEIFVHQTGGDPISGTVDTWLSLGTSRNWVLAWPGGAGTSSAGLQVSIRDAVTLIVKVSAAPIALATHP